MRTLSVVIPFFNTEAPYFERCISSLDCGRGAKLEVIVVDDGSDDDSSYELNAITDGSGLDISVYRKANGGQSSARRYGLERARGEFVLFMDSDDYVDGVAFASLIDILEDFDSDILCFNYDVVSPDGSVLNRNDVWVGGVLPIDLRQGIFCSDSLWRQVYRVQALRRSEVDFVQGVRIGEDLATAVSFLVAIGSASSVGLSVYRYVRRPTSTLGAPPRSSMMDIVAAFDAMESMLGSRLKPYRYEVEWLSIVHILYWNGIRIIQECGPDDELRGRLFGWMDERFPSWRENPYLSTEIMARSLSFRLVVGGHWRTYYIQFRIKRMLKMSGNRFGSCL